MKLVSGEKAAGSARMFNAFISLGLFLLFIKFYLNDTFNVIAELAALIFSKAFYWHFSSRDKPALN